MLSIVLSEKSAKNDVFIFFILLKSIKRSWFWADFLGILGEDKRLSKFYFRLGNKNRWTSFVFLNAHLLSPLSRCTLINVGLDDIEVIQWAVELNVTNWEKLEQGSTNRNITNYRDLSDSDNYLFFPLRPGFYLFTFLNLIWLFFKYRELEIIHGIITRKLKIKYCWILLFWKINRKCKKMVWLWHGKRQCKLYFPNWKQMILKEVLNNFFSFWRRK